MSRKAHQTKQRLCKCHGPNYGCECTTPMQVIVGFLSHPMAADGSVMHCGVLHADVGGRCGYKERERERERERTHASTHTHTTPQPQNNTKRRTQRAKISLHFPHLPTGALATSNLSMHELTSEGLPLMRSMGLFEICHANVPCQQSASASYELGMQSSFDQSYCAFRLQRLA